MTSVLEDGIVEFVLVAEDVLRPHLGILIAENQALVELCLDDEDSVDGYNQVIYLGSALGSLQHYVIEDAVFGFWSSVEFGCK